MFIIIRSSQTGVYFAGCRPAEWYNQMDPPLCRGLRLVTGKKGFWQLMEAKGSPSLQNNCFVLGFGVNERLDGIGLVQSAGRCWIWVILKVLCLYTDIKKSIDFCFYHHCSFLIRYVRIICSVLSRACTPTASVCLF